jgi:AraC-like DNA-binding protein
MKKMIRKPQLFFRILILCVLLVALVTVLVTLFLTISFEQVIISQNARFIQENLAKASNSAVFMTDWAKTLAVQAFYDNDIQALLNLPLIEQQDIARYRSRLGLLRQSSPALTSVYAYNGKERLIYSDIGNRFAYPADTFFDQGVLALLDSDTVQDHLKPVPRLLAYSLDGKLQVRAEVYTFVLYENANRRSPADNAIVLNVSRQWLDNALRTLDTDSVSALIIVDKSCRVVFGGGDPAIGTDLSADTGLAAVLQRAEPSGYILTGSGSARQMITWIRGADKLADWLFVYRLPAESLTRDISRTRRVTLSFALLMLLLGLAGSVAYAFAVYRPISTLQSRLVSLEHESRRGLALQQQSAVRALFLQPGQDESEVRTALQRLDLQIPPPGPLAAVLLAIDNQRLLGQRDNRAEQRALRDAVLSLIERSAQSLGPALCADLEPEPFVLAVPEPADPAALAEWAAAVQAEARCSPGLSLTVVIGTRSSGLHEVPEAWLALRAGLARRIFTGPGSLIRLDGPDRADTAGEYPVAKEKQLIQQLMLRQTDEALRLCDEILGAAADRSGQMIQVTLLRLTSAVMEVTERLRSEGGARLSVDFDDFLTRLNRFESKEEILRAFQELFAAILEQRGTRKIDAHKALIDRIAAASRARLADPALTIDAFESMASLSGIHLARLFRQLTGQSFADYLRQLRLDEACRLIRETNEPLHTIAEQCGFGNTNYFFTVFRREFGITPATYRQHQAQRRRAGDA